MDFREVVRKKLSKRKMRDWVTVLVLDFDGGGTDVEVFSTNEGAKKYMRDLLWDSDFSKWYRMAEREHTGEDDYELPPFPNTKEEITDEHVEAFFGMDGQENFYWIFECAVDSAVK